MALQYHCTRCGNDFEVPDSTAERTFKCTACGAEGAYLVSNTTPNPDRLSVDGLVVGSWRAFRGNAALMISVVLFGAAILQATLLLFGAPFTITEETYIPLRTMALFWAVLFLESVLIGIPVSCVLMLRGLGHFCDRAPQFAQCLQVSFRRLPAIFVSQFVGFILVVLMMVTLIGIPFGVYFLVSWIFSGVVALLTEKMNPLKILAGSRSLVRGEWLRVFLVGIVVWVVVIILAMPYYLMPLDVAKGLSVLGSIIFSSLLTLAVTLTEIVLYLQLRSEKEGLTKTQLAAEIDGLLSRS